MKKTNKNVSAMLAHLATGVGGISQEQAHLNAGYEKIALQFAHWILAGYKLQAFNVGAGEVPPGFDNLLHELTANEEATLTRIQQELLASGGAAVGGLLRGVTGLAPDSKRDNQNPTL